MLILQRITKMAWRYPKRLVVAYISFSLAIGFSLSIPYVFGIAIDQLVEYLPGGEIEGKDVAVSTLVLLALGILGLAVGQGIFDFLRTYSTDSLSQIVAYDIRNAIYDKLQHLSFAYHDKEHTGDLMSKATSDVEAVRRFVAMGLVRSLEVAVRLVVITVILALTNWELALISLGCIPFLVFRTTKVTARLRHMWLRVQQVMAQSVTVIQENLVGIHVVKAFASEEYEKRKFEAKAQELRAEYYKSERLQGTNSAWMTFYFTLAMGLIIWYGGWELIRGDLSAGDLAKFVLYLSQLTFPIRILAFIINSFSRAITSGQRLFDILDMPSPVQETTEAEDMGRARGFVRFEDLSFAYAPEAPALKHVNIAAEPGQVTAILGAPGSGKTTIINLVPRFYDPTEGRITVDGRDIRDFTLESLRHNIGMVQQDVFLFGATIRDNIAYGATDASHEDVVKAAKVAQLHDHIMSLPNGYDTFVGERGATLSGGQRQRMSIARTILIDPPILILDDSTSSVDVETERLIHDAMTNVMKGRTTFVIAHRLSTVREADQIVVLNDGEVVEQGNHAELMAHRGIYWNIYELQLRPQEELLLDAALVRDSGGDG